MSNLQYLLLTIHIHSIICTKMKKLIDLFLFKIDFLKLTSEISDIGFLYKVYSNLENNLI